MIPDLINGSFELFSGIFLWLNVRQLYLDKKIKGVRILPSAFFAMWGFWNLYFYPHLGQWFSFAGGLNIVTANSIWVVQMIYYRNNK